MRYLWITSFAMMAIGILLILGYLAGLLEIFALLAGVLTIWAGIVKLIVLRIWQKNIHAQGEREGRVVASTTTPTAGRR